MNSKRCAMLMVVSVACWVVVGMAPVDAEEEFADPSLRQTAIEIGSFMQIPGPNPIIRTGAAGDWDDENTETGDAFEDLGTYYIYYHSMNKRAAPGEYPYRIGVATATSPLGPFKKYGDGPILPTGSPGSWDAASVACPMILKEGDRKYRMWYCGRSKGYSWSVGLATATHPLGPWKRYEGNPVLKDFGYLGGVVKQAGGYRIYAAHPTSTTGYQGDYSPLAVATAERAEGPYVKYEGNPILEKGAPGDWDDGGFSEAEVLYHNGMYHMFYGGTRIHGPRLESIGYAYSFDGLKWFKYGKNPVASRHTNPNAAAFAEVHAIVETPFIYLYHTLRPERDPVRPPIDVEHIGVQVLVTQRPFRLDMPALSLETLAAGATTALDSAAPICLSNITQLSMTAECKYGEKAARPIRIHVRASYDGLTYDTADLYTLDNDLQPGRLARKTFQLDSKVRFIKVLVENPNEKESVSDVKVIATLGG